MRARSHLLSKERIPSRVETKVLTAPLPQSNLSINKYHLLKKNTALRG